MLLKPAASVCTTPATRSAPPPGQPPSACADVSVSWYRTPSSHASFGGGDAGCGGGGDGDGGAAGSGGAGGGKSSHARRENSVPAGADGVVVPSVQAPTRA